MFRSFRVAPVFLIIVCLNLTDGDQESLSYANCQLTNTCYGRTTDELANERSTTPKINDKEPTSEIQTTWASETSEVYTISFNSKLDIPFSYAEEVIKVKDLIYVLHSYYSTDTILAYDDSFPHDLLTLTVIEEIGLNREKIEWRGDMVGVESTNTLYVSDLRYNCIWKIDMDNSKAGKWLSRLGTEFGLSVANDDHLLVLRRFNGVLYLEIYDQDAKLVRSILLPNDFLGPFHAIQTPNGEFIVSHSLKGANGTCISFLSADGKNISQFNLRETVGFKDVQLFTSRNRSWFATEMFSGNVHIFDENTGNWNLSGIIISNSTNESSIINVSLLNTDGEIISLFPEDYKQSVRLFWDTDKNHLLVAEDVFGNIYLVDRKTFKWRQMGRVQHYKLYCDSRKEQFIVIVYGEVLIWTSQKH